MFAVFTIEEPKRQRPLQRLFGSLQKPPIRVEKLRVENDVIYRIQAVRTSRKLEAERIYQQVPIRSNSVLAPKGCKVPFAPNELFCPQWYPAVLTVRALSDSVRKSGVDLRGGELVVVDANAQHRSLLPPLLSLFSHIRVYTDNGLLYEAFAKRVMEELGATLLLGGEAPKESPVLSFDAELPFAADKKQPVFSPAPIPFCQGKNISGFQVALPAEMAQLVPAGIDETEFAAALFEKNKVEVLSHLPVADALCGTRRIGVGEIGEYIARQNHRKLVGNGQNT